MKRALQHFKLTACAASLCSLVAVLAGCSNPNDMVLESEESQVRMRSIQTRTYESADVNKMLRCCISTLQDLGFVIDSADHEIGTVTGTKLDGYQLRMTISVRVRGTSQIVVRANAQYEIHPVDEPKPYQDFFAALDKAIFLSAHSVQ